MQNDGQLVIKDGSGAVTWTSATETGTSSVADGWTYQITSGGRETISCIHSGPDPAAVTLASRSKAYKLQISQRSASLKLIHANGSQVRRERRCSCSPTKTAFLKYHGAMFHNINGLEQPYCHELDRASLRRRRSGAPAAPARAPCRRSCASPPTAHWTWQAAEAPSSFGAAASPRHHFPSPTQPASLRRGAWR